MHLLPIAIKVLTRAARPLAVLVTLLLIGCQSSLPHNPITVQSTAERPNTAEKLSKTTIDDEPDDIWQRIRQGFALQDQIGLNPRIEHQRLWFVSNPSFLERSSERGSRYLHYVVERLDEHDMPMELALLPMIESAYNPYAYSRSHAAGLWQFIPSTGRYFNLPQNNLYDGRRDITASTRAAIKYLDRLNKMFDGDWLLAMAAYNAGEGTVGRAIERNRKLGLPTDYWNLPLPEETQNYVPKLLALSQIVMSPQAYGIDIAPIANEPYFTKIPSMPGLDLARLAELIEIDKEEFEVLNPAFKRGVTVASGPQHLLIPVEKADAIAAQDLAKLKTAAPTLIADYRVQVGDNLGKIAQRYRVSVQQLKTANGLTNNNLRVGQRLHIPGVTTDQPAASAKVSAQRPASSSHAEPHYQVQAGDNLWQIARRHNVSAADIQRWNGLTDHALKPGQKLKVQAQRGAQADPTYYKVQRGDSLYLIAQRFKVSLNQLRNWNPTSSASSLKPGQTLTVYAH